MDIDIIKKSGIHDDIETKMNEIINVDFTQIFQNHYLKDLSSKRTMSCYFF